MFSQEEGTGAPAGKMILTSFKSSGLARARACDWESLKVKKYKIKNFSLAR